MVNNSKFFPIFLDSVSDSYWQSLAEQRRAALEVTLIENKELHRKNEELSRKVNILEEENRIAKEMLRESETLVDVLKVRAQPHSWGKGSLKLLFYITVIGWVFFKWLLCFYFQDMIDGDDTANESSIIDNSYEV